jgi:hypothetical protein
MNIHDCLLMINIDVMKRLQVISQDDKKEKEKIAAVCSKFFDILRQYYSLIELNIISFDDKMKQLYRDLEYPEQPSILSLLSNWQNSTLLDKAKLASQTFHVFSRTIVSLHKLEIEMKKKGAIFKVQTLVLSTLHGFSIVCGIFMYSQ